MGTEIEEVLREDYQTKVFDTVIHRGVVVEESPVNNESVIEYDPKSKQAKEFTNLLNEFLKRVQDE